VYDFVTEIFLNRGGFGHLCLLKACIKSLRNVMLNPFKKIFIPGHVSSMSFFSLGWRAGMQPREDWKITGIY
jgi:hypothetical protein